MTWAQRLRPALAGDLFERFEPLRILSRHLKLFAFVFCSIVALAIAAYVVMPVRYVATGTVLVGDPDPGVSQTAPGDSLKVGDPADMESQLIIVRSQNVMRRALASPKAQDALKAECAATGGAGLDGNCTNLAERMDRLIDYVSTRYSVGSVGRSRIINISYTSSQPRVASEMANALIDAFLYEQRETASTGRQTAADWLQKEADSLDAEIRTLDKQIADYRSSKGLVRGASAPVNSERLTGISQQLAAAQAVQANATAKLKEITDAGLGGSANATSVLENRTIGDLKQTITEVDSQLANTETTLGPAHPRLKALNDQLRTLNGRLAAEIDRLTRNARKQYDTATERVAVLTGQLEAAKAEVATAVDGEGDIEDIVRKVEIKRRQYVDLASRVNELEVERRVRSGNVRLVSEADVPLKPFFPKKIPFTAAGLTLGLLLGSVAAFLAEKLAPGVSASAGLSRDVPPASRETQTRSREGVRPAPRSPRQKVQFIAAVPYVQASNNRGYTGHPMRPALDSAAADPNMQKALANLDRLVGGKASGTGLGNVVLITSPSIGSGKTFTSAALARSMAAAGKSVLVIDCNQMRPAISDVLGVPASSGRALAGAQDLVLKSPFPGLDIVPSGHARLILPPDYGWEHRFTDLLAWATVRYTHILLDGPSVEFPASHRLVNHADKVLVCARNDELNSEAIVATIAGILSVRQVPVGIVATMIDSGQRVSERSFERNVANQIGL